MSQTANRIVKNTGYLYLRLGLSMFISLWTTRIVLNALGSNDFGIYNVVGGAIGMLGFLNASMTAATQRFINYHQGAGNIEKCKEVFNASILLHFIISVLLVACLILLGWIFFNIILNIPEDRINAAYVVYGCLIISTAFTVMTVPYDATLNAHENMRYYAIVGVLESLLKLIVAFVVANIMVDKLIAYGILMSSIPLIILSIMRVYCQKNYKECQVSFTKYLKKDVMCSLTKFAGWNILASFSAMFTQYGLGILLNHFYGAILNAAQSIANQLSGMLMAFSNSMLKAVNPVITKSEGHGDRNVAIQYAMKGSKFSYILLSFFAIPFIVEMPTMLSLWLKNVPEWAVLFCCLQLVRSLIEQLTVGLLSLLRAHGDIKGLSLMRSMLHALTFIFTTFAFIRGSSPYWMYILWIFIWSLGSCMVILYLSKHILGVRVTSYILEVIVPCILISIVPVLLLWLISNLPISPHLKVTSEISIYIISFILLLRWIVLTTDERTVIHHKYIKFKKFLYEYVH